jgi:hypothetical protein
MPHAKGRSDLTVLTGYCWLGKRDVVEDAPARERPGLSILIKSYNSMLRGFIIMSEYLLY